MIFLVLEINFCWLMPEECRGANESVIVSGYVTKEKKISIYSQQNMSGLTGPLRWLFFPPMLSLIAQTHTHKA